MTIKVGDKYKGNYGHNIVSVVCVSNEYVIIKDEDNLMLRRDSENPIKMGNFLGSYTPYTPPREYWTYTYRHSNDKLLNSPKVFSSEKEARDHYHRWDRFSSNGWVRYYTINDKIEEDTKV